jgi:hypothetical protein
MLTILGLLWTVCNYERLIYVEPYTQYTSRDLASGLGHSDMSYLELS